LRLVALNFAQIDVVRWEDLGQLRNGSVRSSTDALSSLLDALFELSVLIRILVPSLRFSKLSGRFEHVVVDHEVHSLLVGDEEHVDHAITIDVSKVEDLVILDV
jgi:hypothetical protein